MNVAVIKYNAGNIQSVGFALERLGVKANITDDFDSIRAADKVIFPGVGEAGSTMKYLKERGIDQLLSDLKQPVLGICLGQQLMCMHSEEGDTPCIGIFDVPVLRFPPEGKVPHMGWNNIEDEKGDLFTGLRPDRYFYFVHSYYVPLNDYTSASCNYITRFSAALQKDNFYATQFHPEKSGDAGQQVLKNFLEL
ncbi:MAG: imidazole glycerol phosphate synthase subunit HisH [Bacteroidales bacterium]|nr:imidazole glycerol phosphate synthase subunit HisH [Bacteroidales bacterium]MCB9013772.1 imidazole glycerol phosphate synthase subunit HisH [Bacteroidales bacterium]